MRITMKRYYRISLVALLAIDLFFIGLVTVRSASDQIPDTMWTYVGREEQLFTNLPAKAVTKTPEASSGESAQGERDADTVEALNVTGGSGQATLKSQAMGNYSVDVKLFGIFPLKTVDVKVVDPMVLAPSGEPIGIYVETNGLLVLATTSVEGKDGLVYEPASNIVKSGDYILKINGKPVKTIKEFNSVIQKTEGKKAVVRLRRNGTETDVSMKAIMAKDGTYKMGMWVREDTQGIGTMTYVTENGGFGALGHGITDADTGTLMNLSGGELYNTEILDIIKGEKGAPGELEGYINMSSTDNRGMVIRVTDAKLLSLTGGIVQGMSGSPIVQDGKLVGAVTHVLVDDPTRGYGAFIENMLSQ